ncbi:hypothetical protein [Ferdinandcohnia sp. SAFN-114]|uniref:hypothetical protein n=1 Tax=Ferdinandcohnia sp. SAFN-114 TaxID=3387275 RepID=UPI003F80FDC6
MNKEFKDLPKSVKKVIRYIYQDASYEQLLSLEKQVKQAIKIRLTEYEKKEENTYK